MTDRSTGSAMHVDRLSKPIYFAPPKPAAHVTLYIVCGLFASLLTWSAIAEVDIVATAEGRLVPQTFIKIVQPVEAGVLQDILVREGEIVQAGQLLMRMDARLAQADTESIRAELAMRRLQLRRIDAELAGKALATAADDPPSLLLQVSEQLAAHRQSQTKALDAERQTFVRTSHERAAGAAALSKMIQSTPVAKRQADAFEQLGREGYAGQLMVLDKQREYTERLQDERAQESTVSALNAAMALSTRRLAQLEADYRSRLRNERSDAQTAFDRLEQEAAKQRRRSEMTELRAPQNAVVKDLATHTQGAVVTPGTVLMTLVPQDDPLLAEVRIRNDDVGFVQLDQQVRIKLAAYPFQKHGMVDGTIDHVSADAHDGQSGGAQVADGAPGERGQGPLPATYKALVRLARQTLDTPGGAHLRLLPGMQVVAEIHQGRRTVLEYLLSPVQRVVHESGRER